MLSRIMEMLSLSRLSLCPRSFFKGLLVPVAPSKLYFLAICFRSTTSSSSSDSTICRSESLFELESDDSKLWIEVDERDVADLESCDKSISMKPDDVLPLPLALAVLALLNE